MILDASYWQECYLNKEDRWDLGKISAPIKAYLNQLSKREIAILIPGAGNAHEAVYALDEGFTTINVLDFANAPLIALQYLQKTHRNFELTHANFFDHVGQYDLILEQTFFCALEVRFRESYFKQILSLLKPGGKLVGLLFNFNQNREGPPFTCNPTDYKKLIPKDLEIITIEPCINSELSREGQEYFIILQKKYGN